MSTKSSDSNLLLLGVALVAGVYIFRKNIGGAIVNTGSDILGGAAQSIGDIFGLPHTNVAAGEAAWAAGDYMKASELLPAGIFLSHVFGIAPSANPASGDPNAQDIFTAWAAQNNIDPSLDPNAQDIFTAYAATQQAASDYQAALDAGTQAGG